jgi:hypothetical protein
LKHLLLLHLLDKPECLHWVLFQPSLRKTTIIGPSSATRETKTVVPTCRQSNDNFIFKCYVTIMRPLGKCF